MVAILSLTAALAAGPCAGLEKVNDPFAGPKYLVSIRAANETRPGVQLVVDATDVSLWIRVRQSGVVSAAIPAGTEVVLVKAMDGATSSLKTSQESAPESDTNGYAIFTKYALHFYLPPEWVSATRTPDVLRASVSAHAYDWTATKGQQKLWTKAMTCALSLRSPPIAR